MIHKYLIISCFCDIKLCVIEKMLRFKMLIIICLHMFFGDDNIICISSV